MILSTACKFWRRILKLTDKLRIMLQQSALKAWEQGKLSATEGDGTNNQVLCLCVCICVCVSMCVGGCMCCTMNDTEFECVHGCVFH